MKTVVEAFQVRTSVRTFRPSFSEEDKQFISQTIEEVNSVPSPFNVDVKIVNHPPGLGRMGVIHNDAGWLIAAIKTNSNPSNDDYIESGFRLMLAVIKLTQRGIGTVFIAGTFSPSQAEQSVPGCKVGLGVAYGIKAESEGIVSKIFSFFSNSRSRLEYEQLFYDGISKKPFAENSLGEKSTLIQCLRLAPSARNSQQWRFVINDKAVHLFNTATSNDSLMDIGIAAASSYLLPSLNGEKVKIFKSDDEEIKKSPSIGGSYVCSIIVEQI
jgi:hypothetical protein